MSTVTHVRPVNIAVAKCLGEKVIIPDLALIYPAGMVDRFTPAPISNHYESVKLKHDAYVERSVFFSKFEFDQYQISINQRMILTQFIPAKTLQRSTKPKALEWMLLYSWLQLFLQLVKNDFMNFHYSALGFFCGMTFLSE